MKYNPKKSFKGQTQKVQDYIRQEVCDQTNTQPKERDSLGRPSRFEWTFTDETGSAYLVTLTNSFIDNRSWRLNRQDISVKLIQSE